ncbi:hypothetical protein LLG46_07715 [bacterium]|nr:hypothetical protein [bacterium]
MKRVIPIVIIVAVVIGVFFVFSHYIASGQSFEYKFKQGQIDKYKTTMDMTMSMPGMPAKLTGGSSSITMNASFITTQKVVSVKWNGSANMEMSLSDFQMKVPGMPAGMTPSIPDQKYTMTMSKDGEFAGFKDMNGNSSNGMDMKNLFNQMSSYQMPAKRMKLGESYEAKVPMPFGGEMTVISKLAAQNVPIAGTAAAKILQEFKGHCDLSEMAQKLEKENPKAKGVMNKGTMDIDGHGVTYFSTTEGKLIETHSSSNATIKTDMPGSPGGQGEMKMNIKVHMVKAK